jgi:Rps23 Pro-64 3,4-dihydroxylase Tpa1-like proline 4-hydroxylase
LRDEGVSGVKIFHGGDPKALRTQYLNAQPFPHIVLDQAFDPYFLHGVEYFFPRPTPEWWVYDNPLERKYALDNYEEFHESIQRLILELASPSFMNYLEELTGIEGLIFDHRLNGGGLHQITQGGKLDIHADYNYHPVTKLDRRLNVIVYLNPEWNPHWRGQLELWDKSMTKCAASIDPLFNRMVIFSTTDTAYHGHPDPLNCPTHVTRKSIALYYYTNGRPKEECSAPHSTLYQKRPQDPDTFELQELRLKRSIRRLTP